METLYGNPLHKSLQTLYGNPLWKPFTETLYENLLHNPFMENLYRTLYGNPLEKPFMEILYRNPLQTPFKVFLVIVLLSVGIAHLVFNKSGNHYTWRKVTTTVHNIIVGRLWVDNHGEMDITNHITGDRCHLKYTPYSYFSRDAPRKVDNVWWWTRPL